jgi:sulfate adenylyltransferase large subunit
MAELVQLGVAADGTHPVGAVLPGAQDFSVEGYLDEDEARDLLRFSTAGSVDDGKSTLIGRLLYDTQSVYEDNLKSIEGKGTTAPGVLDLALLTDGLRAEREQGITIDVAYRYFSTRRRKFIIADTPGHEQYTRNMATGASTASLAIVLVDARKGVLIQSRRHACITALLGVPHVLVAVNKMDLVAYDEGVFEAICAEFTAFFDELGELRPKHLYFVPVSALTGDNVVTRTSEMPWYEGPSLLEVLEQVPAADARTDGAFRLAVQRVLRPNLDFRGFAGQIAAGTIRRGDAVMALPSRRTSRVRSIVTFDGELAQARSPQSVTLTLEDEIDISRGDLLVSGEDSAVVTTRFTASLVWMDEQPLALNRRYLLKHTSRAVHAEIRAVAYRLNVATLAHETATTLALNGIGVVEIETVQPLAVDRYTESRITGSFVLIDPVTNATAAAGMIREAVPVGSAAFAVTGPVTAEERAVRWRHVGAHVQLCGTVELADAVERTLLGRGAAVLRPDAATAEEIAAMSAAGALVLTHEAAAKAEVTLAGHRATVVSAEDVLTFLALHDVLLGGVA